MFNHLFKIGIRNLLKNKVYSVINITGLAIGLAASLLIANYVIYELSFDNFYSNRKHIYRLLFSDDKGQTFGKASYVAGPELKDHFSQVRQYVRFYNFWGPNTVRYNDEIFSEHKLLYTDSTVFKVFGFPFIKGSPENALRNPNSIVITQSMASKYFGEEDPVNKILIIDNTYNYQVTGVIKDIPANSHIHFDFLVNDDSRIGQFDFRNSWGFNEVTSYVLLSPENSTGEIQPAIQKFFHQQIGKELPSSEKEQTDKYHLYLQPLWEVHLFSSSFRDNLEPQGNISFVIIFSAIALLIILIATFNYVNLTTAFTLNRLREFGLKRVIGAGRGKILLQHIIESMLIILIALGIGVIIREIAWSPFSTMMGIGEVTSFGNKLMILLPVAGLIVLIGIISGTYLGIILLRHSTLETLKGKNYIGTRKSPLKRFSIIAQFSATIILVICTLIINGQLKYLQHENLGFNPGQLIRVDMNNNDEVKNFNVLKNNLQKNPGILGVSESSGVPPNQYHNSDVDIPEDPGTESVNMKNFFCDEGFINLLGMEIVKGRNFSPDIPSDRNHAFILNETAVRELGLKNPIGVRLKDGWGNKTGKVIGVVKDFHFKSFRDKIGPAIFSLDDFHNIYCMVVKISPEDVAGTLSFIRNEWKSVNPGWPFVYHFVDEDFARLYLKDRQTGQVISFFAVIALFISCFGLYGLVSFMTENRNREIGIRKINGATAGNIISLFTGNFIRWIALAFIFSAPVAWYFMSQWLNNFAYKIDIHWWVFVLAGLATMIIAVLTIGFKTWQAARRNPVEILRYE